MELHENLVNTKIENYLLSKKIGEGSFGAVYEAINIVTKKKVALKVKSSNIVFPQLQMEYLTLREVRYGVGIPQVDCFINTDSRNIMAMDLLGPNLEVLLTYCNRSFSLKTILMIADQLLRRIEYIHLKGVIHRDLKPENMVLGVKQTTGTLFLIDFGLARFYCDSQYKHCRMSGLRRRQQTYKKGNKLFCLVCFVRCVT
jgi:serine/threonine protein kinase